MKKAIPFLFFGFTVYCVAGAFRSSQQAVGSENTAINWITFDQLADSMKVHPKRVFIKIYTDWCGPCKLMDKKTLSKERVTEPLERYYYSIAFNAEQVHNIAFRDSVFTFNPNLGRGIHNLALHLGKDAGTLSYPTIVILDENLEILYKFPGFMSVTNLEEVLYLYKDLKK